MIPFSSDIKFNLIIRDMNPSVKNPTTKEDNMCVFMKGAPERVLGRCTKILVNGKDEDLDEVAMFGVQSANDRFGGMGERVLAFARTHLDPNIFKKDPAYPFDVKKWKAWKEVRAFDSSISGWFPMWNLTLVGIVSLQDPPRVGVAKSVLTCQKAGIKVIMVTGDQPPTAAAIAHKVNIISNPDLEYNAILKANPGMSK
jgi:sodium/potassium-transporting ATPase subunit alpha